MTDKQLMNRVKKREELRLQITELEKRKQELEKEIKAFMGDMELIKVGDFNVHWNTSNRLVFNSTRFKNENPGLYNDFAELKTVRSFSVTHA